MTKRTPRGVLPASTLAALAAESLPIFQEWPATTRLQVGELSVDVDEIGVVDARAHMPRLIRASAASGRAFHIRNAKNPQAPTALLISPDTLERWVRRAHAPRTLGQVVDALPFKHAGDARVRVRVPDNTVRPLRVPADGPTTGGLQAGQAAAQD